MTRDQLEAPYRAVFGEVPDAVRVRHDVYETADRFDALAALETWRAYFLDASPLDARTQKLVHFALTLAAGDAEVSAIHARSALRYGASHADLLGVCETAAVVLGLPAYTRGLRAVAAESSGPDSVR